MSEPTTLLQMKEMILIDPNIVYDNFDWDKTGLERPKHKYYISKYLVTESLYTEVMKDAVIGYGQKPTSQRRNVERVDMTAAMVFCNRLTALDKKLEQVYALPDSAVNNHPYYSYDDVENEFGLDLEIPGCRLPTRTEWVFAAMAGQNLLYSGSEKKEESVKGGVVGQKKPNAFGLYDMCGLAWEWIWTDDCEDVTGELDYDEHPETPVLRRPVRGGINGCGSLPYSTGFTAKIEEESWRLYPWSTARAGIRFVIPATCLAPEAKPSF